MAKTRIKELRKEKKLSQEKLGNLFGFKCNTISNWEREIREPDIETIKRLADFFGVTTDYLICRKDNRE